MSTPAPSTILHRSDDMLRSIKLPVTSLIHWTFAELLNRMPVSSTKLLLK
jgi:hypothetical protein